MTASNTETTQVVTVQPYATMGDMADPGTLRIAETCTAFYIGGNTPHVWTPVQINSQTSKYRHPIWVYDPSSNGYNQGVLDGHIIVDRMRALGIPSEVAVSIDMETAAGPTVDPEYLNGAHSVIAPSGYWTSVYSSRDIATKNPVFGGGRWVADWTGGAHLTGIPGEWACQWQRADAPGNNKPWDVSIVKDTSHLWDPSAPVKETAILVRIPSGAVKQVTSVNGGVSWT